MNTQINTMPGSFDSQTVAPASSSAAHTLYWSIRREFWESRSIYLAPLGAAGVALFGFMISMLHLPAKIQAISAFGPAHQRQALVMPYAMVTAVIMGAAFIVSIFYSLDALYSERRDRSILFWKSLPVSDLTVVLSKTIIALVALPLLAFVITVAAVVLMLPMNAAALVGSGFSFAELWNQLALGRSAELLLYHLITTHILWYAPLYAWLLLVSAWAKRAPFLWAFLPPLIIAAFEKITFHTSYFAHMLRYRFMGNPGDAATHMSPLDPRMQLMPGEFFSSPGLWIGLAVAAAFLALAVRMRHTREPI